MKLTVNENNEIISFARIGGLPDSVNFDDDKLPIGFDGDFKPFFYAIQDGLVVDNPNYVEPEPPATGPSVIEQQLAALGYQQMQDSQDKQALIKQNAQMAYQIMQIQQQLGGQSA